MSGISSVSVYPITDTNQDPEISSDEAITEIIYDFDDADIDEISGGDDETIHLSRRSSNYKSLIDGANESDGIDHDTVSKIRQALENGDYVISLEDLADAIALVLKETI